MSEEIASTIANHALLSLAVERGVLVLMKKNGFSPNDVRQQEDRIALLVRAHEDFKFFPNDTTASDAPTQ